MARVSSLLCLLVAGVVHSQTYPYVSFMGQTLANHSYVDISQVGMDSSGSDSVQCHTDLNTCCSRAQGYHRGDWFFPNGARLPFPGRGYVVQSRLPQRVDVRRHATDTIGPAGIYRCDIATDAVHDNAIRQTVYVGIYISHEGIMHFITFHRVTLAGSASRNVRCGLCR